MSCSKIFSGDLPELTYDVIKYFQKDFSTLYSCILVNRLWCRLAIPLLWENPFFSFFLISNKNHRIISIIEIYLNNLNDDFKMKLYEYKIINNSLSSKNMMFDYLKFLKYLNTHKFNLFVETWLSITINNLKPENRLYDSEQNFKRLAHTSLFKIFIENEINLHTLEIEISGGYYDEYLDNTLELILQNQNFIQNVRNLKLYINKYKKATVINNHISQIIHSHQNLKKIYLSSLSSDYLSLYQSLLLSKDHNCSNTLNTIVLFRIKFKLMDNLDKIFEQLNVLESVHIVYCSFLDSNFIQQIINLTKPFKLKSLILNEVPQFESLQQLLLKSADYLENFGVYCNHDISQLLNYCNNINFLYFVGYDSKISTYQKINLIENIKQSLNYLSINIWESKYSSDCSSILLKNLGQILPSKLDYISLDLTINESDFGVFLENSQYSFINKLLILQCGSDDILHYIKDYYIMKKKRVKYLAIKDDEKELFDLKDEVRELELHNIKVQRHTDLYISIYNFINNDID